MDSLVESGLGITSSLTFHLQTDLSVFPHASPLRRCHDHNPWASVPSDERRSKSNPTITALLLNFSGLVSNHPRDVITPGNLDCCVRHTVDVADVVLPSSAEGTANLGKLEQIPKKCLHLPFALCPLGTGTVRQARAWTIA